MRRGIAIGMAVVATLLAVPAVADAQPNTAAPDNQLTIATLPAYPDYPVTLGKLHVRTDSHGVATFPLDPRRIHGLQSRLTLKSKIYRIHDVEQRVDPARVYDNGSKRVIIFNVFYLTRFSFRNSNGGPLDAAVIHNLTVKSSIGAVNRVPAHTPIWLQGSRVVPLSGTLQVKKLYWTIQDVRYAGTSVVNSSQQRFQPVDKQSIVVTLLFYSARLKVHDALFGFRRSGWLTLVYPDGTRTRVRLDGSGSVFLPSLPRGNYSVVLEGFGPRMTQQLAISTNQNLDLKHYSWIDLGVIFVVFLVFTVGLLMIGLRRRRRRPRSSGRHSPRSAPPFANVLRRGLPARRRPAESVDQQTEDKVMEPG
jgi:hypothetical protein